MDLTSAVTLLGGATDRATLVRLRGRREVDRALREGLLERDARGRYSLGSTSAARRTANSVAGVLSHRSAARAWGWAQKIPDGLPEVTVPRNRRVDPRLRRILIPHWSDLPAEHVEGGVTTMSRTLVDCMRNLPFDEALAIVNSALRADDVTGEELRALAQATRGRGRQRIIAVAAAASGKPANAFESVLQAQTLLIPGLEVQPQFEITLPDGSRRHPDLADPELMIAIEAEGFAWHGESAALTRDCRRYNRLTVLGWQVIRFSWAQVMHQPAYVHEVLLEAVALARDRRALLEHANVA